MTSLAKEVAGLGQTVMVLQGGGALGAYQAGAYEATDGRGSRRLPRGVSSS